jgi:hypothetical protein
MNSAKKRPEEQPPEPEIQQGNGRSKAKDDELKRVVRQHPQRDEPRVDSVEEEPPPPPRSRRR